MTAYFPAPELKQFADEDLIIKIGTIIFHDFVQRNSCENGLRLKLEGDYTDCLLLKVAADQFQILLGTLRAWHPLAGQRTDEIRPGIGSESIRNEHGSQIGIIGPAIEYSNKNEIVKFANEVKLALKHSQSLRNSLWLYGRRDCNAADFYMIYEYAENSLGNHKIIGSTLDIDNAEIKN